MQFKSTISMMLVLVISLQMIVTPAFASTKSQPFSPHNVQVKFGLPNEGHIDSFHNAQDVQDNHMEFGFYALRSLAVMKLLRTRMALSEVMGSVEEFNYINRKYEWDETGFGVPQSIKDLYQGKTEILEISEDIKWLENYNVEDNLKILDDTTTGLIALSAQITRYDSLLKYVRNDMWVKAFPDKVSRKHLRRKYSVNFNVYDVEVFLQGHRDGLLAQYHFLSQEEKGVPLYKRIYQILENEFEFPKAEQVQKVSGDVFVQGKKSIELPTQFEDALNQKIKQDLSYPDGKNKVLDRLLPVLKKTLAIALNENFKALDKLAQPVHYSDDKDVFHYLAMNEGLWDEAKKYYSYLDKKHVDLNKAFLQSYHLIDNINLRKSTLKRVGVQMGIALALASAAFTGGSSLAAGGAVASSGAAVSATATSLASAASWAGTASTIILLTQSTYSYLDAKKHGELSQNLFLGSRDMSSMDEAKYYAQIEKSEFRNIILSLILIGAPTATIKALSVGRKVIVQNLKQFIPVTSKEFQLIKNLLNQAKADLALFGQLGKMLLKSNVKAFARFTGTTERLIQLEQIIEKSARMAGMSVARAKSILESVPLTKKIIDWYAGKMEADPLFLGKLLRAIGIDLVMHISSEYVVRGDMFWEELDYVAINSLVGLIIASHLTAKTTISKEEPRLMFNVLLDKRGGFFAKGLSAAERSAALKETFRLFYKPASELALTSAGVSFAVSGAVELLEHYRAPTKESAEKRFERVLLTSLYYGLYIGLVSNVAGQYMNGWVEPKVAFRSGRAALRRQGIMSDNHDAIVAAAKTSPIHNTVMTGINGSETFVENMLFTWGIVNLGIQSAEEEEEIFERDLDGVFFRLDNNQKHATYLFDFLAAD